ncbi:unnamed protein product, partial [Rotaria sp. Silwood2]
MEYDENTNEILFESSKLTIPHMIELDKNKFNFNVLKKRVQELYMASKINSNKDMSQTCLNIEIKDFIEFGYQMNANDLLPIWAHYLALREAPVFMKLIDIQKEHCPHLAPQVILMDGVSVGA